jgi:hypothetical protein
MKYIFFALALWLIPMLAGYVAWQQQDDVAAKAITALAAVVLTEVTVLVMVLSFILLVS